MVLFGFACLPNQRQERERKKYLMTASITTSWYVNHQNIKSNSMEIGPGLGRIGTPSWDQDDQGSVEIVECMEDMKDINST